VREGDSEGVRWGDEGARVGDSEGARETLDGKTP